MRGDVVKEKGLFQFLLTEIGIILNKIGGDPDTWDLNGKWTELFRVYFGLNYARINREKSAKTV